MQDATQEALIAIVRGLPRFDGRARFSTWAYRVATNACLDEMRRRGRHPLPGLPDDDAVTSRTDLSSTAAGIDALPDRIAIDDALVQLPAEFRAAVVLRDLCDLDYAEIARTLDVPPGTVRSRIARGRAQLAALLSTPDGNQEPAGGRPSTRPGETERPLDSGTIP